jgi:type I restriction enzyme M protein
MKIYQVSLEDIKDNDYELSPGRFVGSEDEIDDDVPFEEKFRLLNEKIKVQFSEGVSLQNKIEAALFGFLK